MAETKTSLFRRLKTAQFSFNRNLLFRWISPTVLGCDQDHLSLKAGDLVCYVLPYQSAADLLVIDQACQDGKLPRPTDQLIEASSGITVEDRAFFFLGHPEGTFGRKTQRQQSKRMQRLFEHQSSTDRDIKIVPVSVFWGHQPDREQSMFRALVSENWTVTSRFKKLLAALFHSKHILVQFGSPVSLTDLYHDDTDREPELARRKLLRLLRTHFTREKQAILGPDLSHRRTLIKSIMSSDSVSEVVRQEAQQGTQNLAQIQKLAQSYANEIVSHQSYSVIRFFHLLLTWLWNKLYDGIELSEIEIPKQWAASHEVIYTPCHRSHIDYLLLSYVLYNNGLTPPHIAAGKNLNLPIVGPLLRRAGAFFMRRTFHGDPLYKAVFDEYLHLMFVRGYSAEYFIEGGRSRTGRTLLPRTGMLSMTIRSYMRDATKPIAFLPVYFGYERILEANTYLGELSGESKKSESIFDIFSVFKTFKHEFGKVAVKFGEPIDLTVFLDQHLEGWRQDDFEQANFSKACTSLAVLLAERINDAAIINPVNLVATAMLSTPRQAMERRRLEKQIAVLQFLAAKTPITDSTVTSTIDTAEVNNTATEISEIVDQAVKVIGIHSQSQNLGQVLHAAPREAVLLTYYRNNTIHRFILPSLIAKLVNVRGQTHEEDVLRVINKLFPYIKAELFLNWQTDEIDAEVTDLLDKMTQLKLLKIEDGLITTPDIRSDDFAALTDLARIIEPMLERFFIVTALLVESDNVLIKSLERNAANIAQQLSTIYGINSPEFFDSTLFTRFIKTLSESDVVSTNNNLIVKGDAFRGLAQQIDQLLDPDARYSISHAVMQSQTKH